MLPWRRADVGNYLIYITGWTSNYYSYYRSVEYPCHAVCQADSFDKKDGETF